MQQGKEPQVNADDVEGKQLPFELVDQLASNWGDDLRGIVKRLDQSHEWIRGSLNKLIHAMEKRVEVP